jgi:YgiT-type zinc finger domain-containing protein
MIKNFKCPECGTEAVDGLGDLTFDLPEGQITIRNIPAKVCANGHQYFETPVISNVQRLRRRIEEDAQSYSRELSINAPLPDEIAVTIVLRPVAPSVA